MSPLYTYRHLARIITSRSFIMVGTRSTSSLSTYDNGTAEVIQNLKKGEVVNTGTELRVELGASRYAKVLYKKYDHIYDLQHAVIPDIYKGKGIGSIFAEKIFNHLITQDKSVKIKLTCEFLQHFYEKNQEKYGNYIEK